ncbi:MAG: hypothetical protein ACLVCH_12280 [Roseburia inulinivorans]
MRKKVGTGFLFGITERTRDGIRMLPVLSILGYTDDGVLYEVVMAYGV